MGVVMTAILLAAVAVTARGATLDSEAGHSLSKRQLVTCPGIPGFCTEAYPGDTCSVVCAFGRNNVPECQEDGTWTDIPRCIEHEPGIPEQKTDFCPGIPGYCSLEYPGGKCEFACATGPHISSFCTPDGTWEPYPVCEGDIRETRDGCDPCPGPFGGPRNRTAEARGSSGGFAQPRQPAAVAAPPPRANNNNNFNNARQPAAPPARRNNFNNVRQQAAPPRSNNNNFRQQQQQPQQQLRPAVIQPARQTGFTSAPRPSNVRSSSSQRNRGSNSAGQRQSNNRRNNNSNRQQHQQSFGVNDINTQPGFKRVGGGGFKQQQQSNFGGRTSSSSNNNNRNNNNQVGFGERPRNQNTGFGRNRNNGGGSRNNNNFVSPSKPAKQPAPVREDGNCPGGALDVCIDVCPSFTARIFGACVAGCARRCPNKK